MKVTRQTQVSNIGNFVIDITTYEPDSEHNHQQLLEELKRIYAGTGVERHVGLYNVKVINFHAKYNTTKKKQNYFND